MKDTSEYNLSILKQFFDEFEGTDSLNPKQFALDWLKGNPSKIDMVSHSLATDYYLEIRNGYRTKEIFLTSFLSFKITDYINQKYKFQIDFKTHRLLAYNYNTYLDLCFITISMLINKYNPATLYREHIIFICIKVAITYFTLYKDNDFLINRSEISTACNELLNIQVDVYNDFACRNGFKYTEQIAVKKKRYLTREQVYELIQPGDTQTDIKKKIMRWCPCEERKARKMMHDYGLT